MPKRPRSGLVVGMKYIVPARTVGRAFKHTGEVIPLLIEIVVAAVGQRGPHHLRHGVGNGAELGLTVAQRGFHAHLGGDVHLRHDRADHIFVGVPNRFGVQQDGAALARRAEGLDFHDVARRPFSAQRPHQTPFLWAHRLPVPGRVVGPPGFPVGQFLHVFSGRVFTPDAFVLKIEQPHLAALVGHANAHGHGLQDGVQALTLDVGAFGRQL